jgi:hypothetical protein
MSCYFTVWNIRYSSLVLFSRANLVGYYPSVTRLLFWTVISHELQQLAVSLPINALRYGDISHARTNGSQRLFMFSGLKESDATRQVNTATTLFDDHVHCCRLHCCAAINNYILIVFNLILCQIRQTTWSILMCFFSLSFFRPVKHLPLEYWISACNLTWSQCALICIIIPLIKRAYINRGFADKGCGTLST